MSWLGRKTPTQTKYCCLHISQAMRKGIFGTYANTKDPDQPTNLHSLIRAFIKGTGYLEDFLSIFQRRDNFCNFLFGFLHGKTFLKRDLSWKKRVRSHGVYSKRKEYDPLPSEKGSTLIKGRICIQGKRSLLQKDHFFRKETKTFWQRYLSWNSIQPPKTFK